MLFLKTLCMVDLLPAHKIFIEKPVTDYRDVHNPGFVFWTCSVTKLPFYQFSWVTLIFMKFCLWLDLLHDYQIFCYQSLIEICLKKLKLLNIYQVGYFLDVHNPAYVFWTCPDSITL